MKTVVQVMKKGYNNSYLYTEYFLHNALQHFGFCLTRDEKSADFSVTAYIDYDAKYFLLTSPFFDRLQGDQRQKLCEAIAVAMKSEVRLHPQLGEILPPNALKFEFLYSSTSNAYEEPALIESGDSDLELDGNWWRADQSGNVGFAIVNYGGPTQGLDVILQAPFWAAPFLFVESAQVRRVTKWEWERREMVFEKRGSSFHCRLEDFAILPGRNRMSALWCRARTKYECAEFYIDLNIKNKGPLPTNLLVTVKPLSGKGFTTTFPL